MKEKKYGFTKVFKVTKVAVAPNYTLMVNRLKLLRSYE